jgi:hypothetical protein
MDFDQQAYSLLTFAPQMLRNHNITPKIAGEFHCAFISQEQSTGNPLRQF